MALVSQTIKNLIAGISQQPNILRYPEQASEQVNGWSSTTDGLQKRPPTHIMGHITGTLGQFPLVHTIHRDGGEKYFLTIANGQIRVFTMDGQERTVHYPNGAAYLAGANERRDLRVITVADYTFIVNRNITVQEAARKSPTRPSEGLVNVKGGQYGRHYQIFINGALYASFKTPDGGESSHSQQIATDYIAVQLREGLVNNLPSGWTVGGNNNWLHIRAPNGHAPFSITTNDGFGGQNVIGMTDTVQRFNMLPAEAPDGYHIEVTGEDGNDADTYYVRYHASKKVWKETLGKDLALGPEPATMPHTLVREADGTFTFKQAEWVDRKTGDDDSNPMPSFIGKRIRDVFFFRNRLGFLADENIILSATGEFFTFFCASVVTLGDSDPIDVAVSHNRVSTLYHAVPFGEELLLFGQQTQFVLRTSGILSPRDVRVDQSTEYDCNPFTRPIGAGRRVYFHVERSRFSAVKEYFAAIEDSAVKATMDVTAHCPNYIPNGIHKLISSTTEDVVLALTDGAPSQVYLYKYLFIQDERVQSSWSRWDFGPGVRVLGAGFVGPMLYFLMDRDGQLGIEAMTFTSGLPDYTEEPYRVHLDRKFRVSPHTAVYDEHNDLTLFDVKLVYGNVTDPTNYTVVLQDGTRMDCDSDGIARIGGDVRGAVAFIGKRFTFFYEFSQFLIKQANASGGSTAEHAGRLQLRYAQVDYGLSGPFTVLVNSPGRRYEYLESGRNLGSATNILGNPPLQVARCRFPVQSLNTECRIAVQSEEPTPIALISAAWDGLYFRRSQRI